jgi:hypothetical protein
MARLTDPHSVLKRNKTPLMINTRGDFILELWNFFDENSS